jgi:hypothetical protein
MVAEHIPVKPLMSSDHGSTSMSTSTVDAINAALIGEPLTEWYHGVSSAGSNCNNVRQTTEGSFVTSFENSSMPVIDYVLPARTRANALSDDYWRLVYPIYPFVDRRNFQLMNQCLWDGRDLPPSSSYLMRLDELISVAMLNLVMALGCLYRVQHEPSDAPTSAETFYKRADSLVRIESTGTANLSLQLIQVMLLMAQYLNGTEQTHKAWRIARMAIRSCHHLGLHRQTSYNEELIPERRDREFVRRIYHGCFTLERQGLALSPF